MTTSDKPAPEVSASFPGPACGAVHEDGSRCTNTVHDNLTQWHFCSSNGRTWYAKRMPDNPAPAPVICPTCGGPAGTPKHEIRYVIRDGKAVWMCRCAANPGSDAAINMPDEMISPEIREAIQKSIEIGAELPRLMRGNAQDATAALDYVNWREAHPVRLEDLMNAPENPRQPLHPPPWRWSPLNVALQDANGNDVLTAPCGPCSDLVSIEGSERALELVRVAPEMEALLRDLDDQDARVAAAFDGGERENRLRDRVSALLARIDAAKAAG